MADCALTPAARLNTMLSQHHKLTQVQFDAMGPTQCRITLNGRSLVGFGGNQKAAKQDACRQWLDDPSCIHLITEGKEIAPSHKKTKKSKMARPVAFVSDGATESDISRGTIQNVVNKSGPSIGENYTQLINEVVQKHCHLPNVSLKWHLYHSKNVVFGTQGWKNRSHRHQNSTASPPEFTMILILGPYYVTGLGRDVKSAKREASRKAINDPDFMRAIRGERLEGEQEQLDGFDVHSTTPNGGKPLKSGPAAPLGPMVLRSGPSELLVEKFNPASLLPVLLQKVDLPLRFGALSRNDIPEDELKKGNVFGAIAVVGSEEGGWEFPGYAKSAQLARLTCAHAALTDKRLGRCLPLVLPAVIEAEKQREERKRLAQEAARERRETRQQDTQNLLKKQKLEPKSEQTEST